MNPPSGKVLPRQNLVRRKRRPAVRRVPVGNMLPAMFLPIAYIPLAEWLSNFAKIGI